ncbi:MAG: hypothetical protein HY821_12345 [Acidobacteria bacterium]|nr:hypothetical protein [Acidobacteriota bacterium]
MKPLVWIAMGFVWLAALLPATRDVCVAEPARQESSAPPTFAAPAGKDGKQTGRERRRGQQARKVEEDVILFTVR